MPVACAAGAKAAAVTAMGIGSSDWFALCDIAEDKNRSVRVRPR